MLTAIGLCIVGLFASGFAAAAAQQENRGARAFYTFFAVFAGLSFIATLSLLRHVK